MGLYMNEGSHPGVYKNCGHLCTSNQQSTQIDYYQVLIEEQRNANASLQQAFKELQISSERLDRTQGKQWEALIHQLVELKESHRQLEGSDEDITQRLEQLNQKNGQLGEEIKSRFEELFQSNLEMVQRLRKMEADIERITSHMAEQVEWQKELSSKMEVHDDRHQEVMSRLETQEAISEKILRQVQHLRSVIYERSSELAEKIESGYQLTASCVHQWMTGSDRPVSMLMLHHQNKQQQE